MPKRSRRYSEAAKDFDKTQTYEVAEAVQHVKELATAKFDETIEMHIRLGVDGRHADQQVRGATVLPHGTGKSKKVLVFAKGAKAEEAEAAGFTDGEEAGTAEEPAETEDAETFGNTEEESSSGAETAILDTSTELSGMHHAEIIIKDYGEIDVELNADEAPITVTNFVKLAQEGFYDGLTFHRIIDGFMMQGGDPLGNGTGGSEETIKGEFSDNGVENTLSHTKGAISMARSSNPDSASSQFFIVQADSTFLDGQYAVFGYVTEGQDIVDKICAKAQPTDDNGTIPADAQPVIESIAIID